MKDEDRQLGLGQQCDYLAVESGLPPELMVVMHRHDNKIAAALLRGLRDSRSEMVLFRMDGLDIETGLTRGPLGASGDLRTFALMLTMLVFGLRNLFR